MAALLEETAPRRTIIVISHRPSAVDMCDVILEVQGGGIAEKIRLGRTVLK